MSEPIPCLAKAGFKCLPDIDVKLPDDKKDKCFITGSCLLSPSTLLVCDRVNEAVKVVDTDSGTVKSSLKIPSMPWDIALISQEQAAVTIPREQTMHIISTKPDYSLLRSMKVSGECFGIDSNQSNFAVAYQDPPKVEVMSHSGENVKVIGQGHFKTPTYVAIRQEGVGNKEVVYVTDRWPPSLTKWNTEGELLFTYSDPSLSEPQGLVITKAGQLIVASQWKDSIHLVSQDGIKLRNLLNQLYGIEYPLSVCYSEESNTLYVSSGQKDFENALKVYTFLPQDAK